MDDFQRHSIDLPADLALKIEAKVASGEYETELDVLRDGLQALDDRSRSVDDWVIREVIPTYDRIMSGIEKSKSAVETWDSLKAHISQKTNGNTDAL